MGGGKDNRALFLKQYAIISIALSIVFLEILGGSSSSLEEDKSHLGEGAPAAPSSRRPVVHVSLTTGWIIHTEKKRSPWS